jgi:hypothetical protein
MNARTRALFTPATLLAAAAAAVAFAYFGIERKDEAKQAREESQAKLYAFAPSLVKSVELTAKGSSTRLVRAGEGWRVEKPVQADADRSAVEALVNSVSELKRKSAIADRPEPAQLAQYGLSSPRARLTLTLEDGRQETLALGDENEFDGTTFVRVSSGAIALVPGEIRWPIEKSTLDLREKRLLPFEERDLARIEITTPTLAYALAREEAADGGWRLDSPLKGPADAGTTSRVLGAIRGLRATAFVGGGGPDAARALERPRFTVRLVPAKGAPRALVLGEAPAGKKEEERPSPLYARLAGSAEVATVAGDATKDLEVDLFALRDRRVLRFDRDAVAAVRFTPSLILGGRDREAGGGGGAAGFEVRKVAAAGAQPEAWKVVAPGDPAVAAGKMDSVLWTLSSLEAKAFADERGASLAAFGLGHPAIEVTLLDREGKELDRLAVSPARGGKTYARGGRSARVDEIEASALASLPRSAQDLAEKAAQPAPQAQAGEEQGR